MTWPGVTQEHFTYNFKQAGKKKQGWVNLHCYENPSEEGERKMEVANHCLAHT